MNGGISYDIDNTLIYLKYSHHTFNKGEGRLARIYIAYEMYNDGKLLFSGSDYSPSPLISWDSLESALGLLGFLTLRPGDTDDEYFQNYTDLQKEWANSFECENLSGLVSSLENKEIEYTLHENASKNSFFVEINWES